MITLDINEEYLKKRTALFKVRTSWFTVEELNNLLKSPDSLLSYNLSILTMGEIEATHWFSIIDNLYYSKFERVNEEK